MRRIVLLSLGLLSLGLQGGCQTNKRAYPDSLPGWHSPDYHVVLGVLQRAGTGWILRYDLSNGADPYGGKFALTPAEKMVGYRGGEVVEVRGLPQPQAANPQATGTLFQVESIRIFSADATR